MQQGPSARKPGKVRQLISLAVLVLALSWAFYSAGEDAARYWLPKRQSAVLVIVAIPIAIPLSYLIHEAGHAIMGWLCGFTITSFGIYPGSRIWIIPWGRTRIFIGTDLRRAGLTLALSPKLEPSWWQWVGLFSGGVLANLLFGGLCLAIATYRSQINWFAFTFAAVNAIGVLNLLPIVIGKEPQTLYSDGFQIWRRIRGMSPAMRPLPAIQSLRAIRPLLQAVRDEVYLRYLLLIAAIEAVGLEMREYSSHLMAEVDSLTGDTPSVLLAISFLAKACLKELPKESDSRETDFQSAERLFQENHDERGALLVAWARAHVKHRNGESQGARTDVDALLSNPVVTRDRQLRSVLLAQRLILCTDPLSEDLVKLIEDYQTARRDSTNAQTDVSVYHAIGRYYAKRQDWSKAFQAYRKAIVAGEEIYWALDEQKLMQEFARTRSGLLQEANECTKQLGLPPLAAFNGSADEREEQERQEFALKLQHSRLWLKRALIVAVFDLLALACLSALFPGSRDISHSGSSANMGLLLFLAIASNILFFLVMFLFTLVFLVVRPFNSNIRTSFGQMLFVFAVCPWIVSVLIGIAGILGIPF
jgi:tetratricopeptide (TPR) repeat protein